MLRERFAFLTELVFKKPVLVAVVSGIVAMMLASTYLRQREVSILNMVEPIPVVVSARTILPGEIINEEDMSFREVEKRFVEPGALLKKEEVAGKTAAVKIEVGAQIVANQLARLSESMSVASIIPAGLRAAPVYVSDDSFSRNLIKPYDRVDAIATFAAGKGAAVKTTTVTIASDVLVLAVGGKVADLVRAGKTNSDSKPINETRMALTLALTPIQVQEFGFAQQSGVLSVALRPIGEQGGVKDIGPTTISNFLEGRE